MSNIDFIVDFRDGAYLEITGKTNELFVVDFYDLDTGILEFTQTARVGSEQKKNIMLIGILLLKI